jgi:F0F1-type ATP synthase assembly protein I
LLALGLPQFAAVKQSPDDRAPLAQALSWSTAIITIALEMVLPAVLGLWVDRKLGTKMVFLILGAAAGLAGGMIHLIRLATASGGGTGKDKKPPGPEGKP